MVHIPHGAIAAAHTERQRKRMEEEEEKMTLYNNDDLNNNWEFKIVRSDSNAFRRPEMLQELIDGESISGWEMLEKLDDNRVRFKRPKSARNNDFNLPAGIDPYRSRFGRQSTVARLGIAMGIIMIALLVGMFFLMEEGSSLSNIEWASPTVMVPIIGIMVVLLGVAFAIKRRG